VRADVSVTSDLQETTEKEIFCRPVPSKLLLNWDVQRTGRIACTYRSEATLPSETLVLIYQTTRCHPTDHSAIQCSLCSALNAREVSCK